MDRLADVGCNLLSPKREVYSHTVIAIFDDEQVMANNLEDYLYEEVNGKSPNTYISEKYDWDNDIMGDILWSALGNALKSYSKHRQRKTVQMFYE